MSTSDDDGRFWRAAEVNGGMRFLRWTNDEPDLFNLVKAVVNIRRLLAGPHLAHGVKESAGANVILVVAEIITISAPLGIVAAADDIHRQPTPQQVFEGGEFVRGRGWRSKTRATSRRVVDLLRR